MLDTLLLKLPRNTEVTPEMAQNFLAALPQAAKRASLLGKLFGKKSSPVSLELVTINQQIQFLVTCDSNLTEFIKTQLQSNYPLVIIEKIADPLAEVDKLEVGKLNLTTTNHYPIQTFPNFTDVDPLSSVLAVLSKAEPDEFILVQLSVAYAGTRWQGQAQLAIDKGRAMVGEEDKKAALPEQAAIREKISYSGYYFTIRLAVSKKSRLNELFGAFGVYSRADGNSLSLQKPLLLGKKSWMKDLMARIVKGRQILNTQELATLWHLPGEKVKVATIAWGQSVLSEPPDNLPIAGGLTDEQKSKVNFFGRTLFKNKDIKFGIKNDDRRRHIWSVGKTGTGKSTLIANMAIDDLKKDRGLAVIDPHGDLSEIILNYIPSRRINDVIYFNPADREYTVTLNPLETVNKEERELVVSGIVAIFHKLYGHSWGPRLEYILRNTLLSLAELPGTTLADVIRILTNDKYRQKVVDKLTDEVMKRYWVEEFNKMPDRLKQESISPILNKVGQFVSSPLIRSVISPPKSSINLDDIMNSGKILIANLSQGRLGEDNAALLGAMFITKLQLAAMRRVNVEEEKRRDFYLYVDEFQNFATTSFIKILSEARKYRLNLMMANQYMAQVPEDVVKAMLGNAGTIVAFTVGAEDASILKKEFSEVFEENDLVSLSNYQVAIKLMIDAHVSRPFFAHTLPLPVSKNQNREKVISVSRERYAKRKKKTEGKRQETTPKGGQASNKRQRIRERDKEQGTRSL